MRLHFSHPPVAADENGGGKDRHNRNDEIFLLMVLMLGPVIASLPPVSLSALLQGALWTLLALVIATTVTLVLFVIYLIYSWPTARKIKPMRAVAFQPDLVPNGKFDTIVIGSGSGGSTCSNLLAQSGQRVLVLEQHPTVTGGCTHSFREQKCTSLLRPYCVFSLCILTDDLHCNFHHYILQVSGTQAFTTPRKLWDSPRHAAGKCGIACYETDAAAFAHNTVAVSCNSQGDHGLCQ